MRSTPRRRLITAGEGAWAVGAEDETVLLLDERRHVLTVNDACRALLGYDAGELSGRELASLFRREGDDDASPRSSCSRGARAAR